MQSFYQRDELSIKNIDLSQPTTPDRAAGCYTLILVQSGEGYYVVNGNQFAYRPGDVCLLGIQDECSFQARQSTKVYWLNFSVSFANSLLPANVPGWSFLGQSAWLYQEAVAAGTTDKATLRALISILLSEERGLHPLADNPVVDGLMKTLLSLIDRLFTKRETAAPAQSTYSSDITRRIVAYISQHISEPHRLRIDTIANEFNYSPGHLSALFRQQIGDSIQQFIIRHKLKLVALRLRHTSLTVSQIADEFGFSDVCHLNKQFKRQYRYSPTIYRQSLLVHQPGTGYT